MINKVTARLLCFCESIASFWTVNGVQEIQLTPVLERRKNRLRDADSEMVPPGLELTSVDEIEIEGRSRMYRKGQIGGGEGTCLRRLCHGDVVGFWAVTIPGQSLF